MKLPMFTMSPDIQDPEAYKECRVVSREEHTIARSQRAYLRSRQEFFQYGEEYQHRKFILGKHLANYLKSLSTKTVLSLGSGECYHEYAIKLAAPEIEITATDFDPFVVEKVSEFLPEIDNYEVFDIKKGDFLRFRGKYDAVLMISVEYVLSDDEVVDFFKRVPMAGANHIIIVSSSYLSAPSILKHMLLLPLSYLKRLALDKKVTAHRGRFHGWSRSKGEFVRLMRISGMLKLQKVITGEPFSKSQALLHIVPENGRT